MRNLNSIRFNKRNISAIDGPTPQLFSLLKNKARDRGRPLAKRATRAENQALDPTGASEIACTCFHEQSFAHKALPESLGPAHGSFVEPGSQKTGY